MPYITQPDGSLKYVVSRWTKDDLPTWHELYYDFYLPHEYSYTPGNYQLIDHYWKIPRKVYLLATASNQLNKMIGEDGDKQNTLRYLNHKYFIGADNMGFRLNPDIQSNLFEGDPIYALPHPKGEKNIFAVKDVEYRVNVNEMLRDPISLRLCVHTSDGNEIAPYGITNDIVAYILQSVISYFEGSVGWKN